MTTVSVADPPGPVAASRKVSGVVDEGIVNVGLAVPAAASVTGVPTVCVQVQLDAPVDALPSRVTASPTSTVRSGPASATGGATAPTVTVTSSVTGPPGPCAVSRKPSTPPEFGAVNDAVAVPAPVSGTVVPEVWAHDSAVACWDAEPSRVTTSPCVTVRSGPATATTWSALSAPPATTTGADPCPPRPDETNNVAGGASTAVNTPCPEGSSGP